jgi:hypothetical protein
MLLRRATLKRKLFIDEAVGSDYHQIDHENNIQDAVNIAEYKSALYLKKLGNVHFAHKRYYLAQKTFNQALMLLQKMDKEFKAQDKKILIENLNAKILQIINLNVNSEDKNCNQGCNAFTSFGVFAVASNNISSSQIVTTICADTPMLK